MTQTVRAPPANINPLQLKKLEAAQRKRRGLHSEPCRLAPRRVVSVGGKYRQESDNGGTSTLTGRDHLVDPRHTQGFDRPLQRVQQLYAEDADGGS
jgi:hypothetical protein